MCIGTRYLIILLSLALPLLSCSKNSSRTPEQNYYVEIRTHQDNSLNKGLSEYLATSIPQKKYTITYRSGMVWPYYAAFDLDQNIPIDSLMPPHSHIHKMVLGDSNSVRSKDDHLVRIDLMPYPDTIPNYQVRIFEGGQVGLVLSGSSDIHFIDPTEFSSQSQLYEYFLESVIRYSFK